MLQPPERPQGIMPQIEVIITQPYPNTKYHTELGIFPSHLFGFFAEPHGEEYELEHGPHIGLEWRTRGGTKLSKSDRWAQDAYILSSPAEKHLTPNKLPKLDRYHSLIKPAVIRVDAVLSGTPKDESNPEEWIEYAESLQEYVNYLKFGLL